MPRYDYYCETCDKTYEEFCSFANVKETSECQSCGSTTKRKLFYPSICIYGTDKFSDKGFMDASEAAGYKITNTKQIDKLEKQGFMQAVTNPSRHRTYKDRK